MSNELVIWDDNKIAEIKKLYAPNLSNDEFQIFCQIGKSTGLNPFLRELWAVKYGSQPASIFIGRDGYRKSAQASPLYDWHSSEDVHENDIFHIKNGEIIHEMNMKDRGKLVGAYALCQRKGSTRPNYARVDLSEYNTGKSVWATKPSTMIKKVAEAQVLRMTFQDLFAGTYDESEQWDDKEEEKTQTKNKEKTQTRKVIDMTPEETIDNEPKISQEDQDKLYENYIDRLDKVTTKEELQVIYNDLKDSGNTLGKVYIDDLADRIKSMLNDLKGSEENKKSEKATETPKIEEAEIKEAEIIETKEVEKGTSQDDIYITNQNAFIAEIKACTTIKELDAVMVKIDTALTNKQISLSNHGVLQSHKGIMLKKLPK